MGLVLFLVAVIWITGAFMGVPRRTRDILVLVLFLGVLVLQVALPDGHTLREATGKSPALWVLLAGFVGVVLLYRKGLVWLRTKANRNVTVSEKPRTFSDTELTRYARHIVLREVGGPGQKRLKDARVLVVGAGGLGSPVLQYLAAAGVGTIGVIDGDIVENANLQRQIIHRDKDIGLPKVFSAQAAMLAQNPFVQVHPYHKRLDDEIARDLMSDYDIIMDGTDNFETRYLVNRVAVDLGKPLISGALSQWEGQVSVFDPANGTPCYRCIFDAAPAADLAPSCAQAGVIGPLPGVIGSIMALEAVKLITGAGDVLKGRMLIFDGLYGETRQITLKRREDCPVCASSRD
jgi:molybdopterin/thiamine biosynthesis adenylyltransferase